MMMGYLVFTAEAIKNGMSVRRLQNAFDFPGRISAKPDFLEAASNRGEQGGERFYLIHPKPARKRLQIFVDIASIRPSLITAVSDTSPTGEAIFLSVNRRSGHDGTA